MWTNSYVPYWISALSLKFEGDQVTNDMYVWEAKKFARKLHYKDHEPLDHLLKNWR